MTGVQTCALPICFPVTIAKQVGPKKTKRTFKTAKPYKKKQRIDPNALQVCTVKGSCPVPDVYNCQFYYGGYDPINMSSANNYSGQYIYAANSLYDPLQSGGGAQPYYYDQLIAPAAGTTGLFKAWKVSGCKIELEFCSAASNTVPVYIWFRFHDKVFHSTSPFHTFHTTFCTNL